MSVICRGTRGVCSDNCVLSTLMRYCEGIMNCVRGKMEGGGKSLCYEYSGMFTEVPL